MAAKQLLADVREFGYLPQERRPSEDAELEQERLLAKRIGRSNFEEFLTPAELKEFKALPRKCRANNGTAIRQPVETNDQDDQDEGNYINYPMIRMIKSNEEIGIVPPIAYFAGGGNYPMLRFISKPH